MGVKTILFTDIGNDVSSVLSLVYLATSPAVDLELVVTTSGNPVSKAWVAKTILEFLGKNTRVAIGSAEPLKGKAIKPRKYESAGLALQEVQVLDNPIRAVLGMLSPVEDLSVRIVVNAPYTDLAKAYCCDKRLFHQKINSIYTLGELFEGKDRFHADQFNDQIAADPRAAGIIEDVLSEIPFVLVPSAFGINIPLYPEFFEKINLHHPVGVYIHKLAERSRSYSLQHGSQKQLYRESQAVSLPHSSAVALALGSPRVLASKLRQSDGAHCHAIILHPYEGARETLEQSLQCALTAQYQKAHPRRA